MPTRHEYYTWSYEELSDTAKLNAVDSIRSKLSGPWWDECDNDAIREVIVWTLADKLGYPDTEKWGVGDFPGIPHLEVTGWDIDRGTIEITGRTTRSLAPNLPWVNGLATVYFGRGNRVSDTYWDNEDVDEDVDEYGVESAIDDAMHSALSEALQAGQREYEYKTSAEYALEWIEANEPAFTEEGNVT